MSIRYLALVIALASGFLLVACGPSAAIRRPGSQVREVQTREMLSQILAVRVYKDFQKKEHQIPLIVEPGHLYLWGTILYDSRPRHWK